MEVAEGQGAVDAVVRMQDFKAKHPDITFTPPSKERSAFWEVRDGDEVVASGYWLYMVMDALERKYS